MPTAFLSLLPPEPVIPASAMMNEACMITTPDYFENRDVDNSGSVPALTIAVSSFTNSCGDEMTLSVDLVDNVVQDGGDPNLYHCVTSGVTYAINVTWSSVSGSYTEFRTGNCTSPV